VTCAHPGALQTVLAVLGIAVDLEYWPLTADALLALAALGDAATSALPRRPGTDRLPAWGRPLRRRPPLAALGAGPTEIMPLLLDALHGATPPMSGAPSRY
jgi:hypothetical protein